LKCDIRKFFANIDHEILVNILVEYIPEKNILGLLKNVIESFETKPGVGLPLGNLTSQLFVNIYMNKFDQFMKHRLKVKYYLRYCDDFVIFSEDKIWLKKQIPIIAEFLRKNLKLELHPNKISTETLFSGVDFLGLVNFPHHRILRTKTKNRMIKKLQAKQADLQRGSITEESFNQSLQSYLGILKHCAGRKIRKKLDELG
jgi:RNA-directed DNA polymerase